MSASTENNTSRVDNEGEQSCSSLTPALGDTEMIVVLHPQGDLTLRIGAEQDDSLSSSADVTTNGGPSIGFVVCSSSLAQASPFFNALLFGKFAEAQHEPGSSWIVDLHEDCPESMHILLAIVHGCTGDIPSTLSIAELEVVIVQADKYDMMSLLGPWMSKWLDPNMDIRSCDDKWRLAWIAWKTGAVTLFKKLAGHLGKRCRRNDEGGLVEVKGFPPEWDELEIIHENGECMDMYFKLAKDLNKRYRLHDEGGLVEVEGPLAEWDELDDTGFAESVKQVRHACRHHHLVEPGPQNMNFEFTMDPRSYQGSAQELAEIFWSILPYNGKGYGDGGSEPCAMRLTEEQEEQFRKRARAIGWSP
ncbi:hypothetical protein CSUB01_03151 [Colletotrichum sublineola]|uniref:Uncharacterized protein n=1 Tax=Colletotrichum sublineola TaxID=1173701 RepID=A0A066XD96_COLSU|nr:hypothetical protein CSUB01_03151 [Colletotrichum sublineola]